MARKTTTSTKPATPAKRPAKPVAKSKPAAKAKRTAEAIAAKKPAFTRDDIALRAYFIAEKRHAHGLPGNEHHDWIEAERQLAAESKRPRKTKKT